MVGAQNFFISLKTANIYIVLELFSMKARDFLIVLEGK